MKTIYLKKKRSGNYEISNRKDFTVKFNKVNEFTTWFNNSLRNEKTTTWCKANRSFKKAQVIKSYYSQSQTYFNSAKELVLANS